MNNKYNQYLYLKILKNHLNYNFIFFNKKYKIYYILNLNNIFLKKKILFKFLKFFIHQNGLKYIYLSHWFFFGLKYNLILNLIKK